MKKRKTTDTPVMNVNIQPSLAHEQIKVDGKILAVEKTVPLGDFTEILWGHEKLKIEIRDIRKEVMRDFITERKNLAVEIKFTIGGGLVYGGEYTKKTSTNTYLMIPCPDPHGEEPYAVYKFSTAYKYLECVCVKHINEHAKTVTLDIKGFNAI
ncbi:MAG: hypothetical protein JW847_06915 [Candidatus Omnitrophica bacterium]|nr:hypothetical protein [Candidatus Omnitrophota bacterium]